MLKMIKYYIQQSWLLIISAFFFGLLLAVTNAAWSGRIEENKIRKLNELMSSLVADSEFTVVLSDVEVEIGKGKIVKTDLYKADGKDGKRSGFCFIASGPGFADKIELVIAVDAAFEKIAGYNVLSSNETPGFGDQIVNDYYRRQFIGAPVEKLTISKGKEQEAKIIDSEIIAISGATVSSDAVVKIFNNFTEPLKSEVSAAGLLTGDN